MQMSESIFRLTLKIRGTVGFRTYKCVCVFRKNSVYLCASLRKHLIYISISSTIEEDYYYNIEYYE